MSYFLLVANGTFPLCEGNGDLLNSVTKPQLQIGVGGAVPGMTFCDKPEKGVTDPAFVSSEP
ncbi:hypothetical protein AGMMS50293_11200 [Spirochaetia bacterium]|nr:hypothetical protein AGMMS50293_11200 [Spirochaetia bacterium]